MQIKFLIVGALVLVTGCAKQRVRFERFRQYAPYRFAGPAPKPECSSSGQWKWCVDQPPASVKIDPTTILYVLHHAGGSERTWTDYPVARKFYAWFAKRKLPAPRVVAVSYGRYWTLMEEAGETQPALLRPFVDGLLPEIEGAFKPAPTQRMLWGTSQGGLNGASLILREPELFARAVLSCPAIFSFPMYSNSEADAYIVRLKAVRKSVYWGLGKLRPLIGGDAAWEREGPLSLVAAAETLPPTLVQVNNRDEYGFQDGGRKFAALARSRGLPVTIEAAGDAHCVIDPEPGIAFLFDLLGG